jgi:hypothetical protein
MSTYAPPPLPYLHPSTPAHTHITRCGVLVSPTSPPIPPPHPHFPPTTTASSSGGRVPSHSPVETSNSHPTRARSPRSRACAVVDTGPGLPMDGEDNDPLHGDEPTQASDASTIPRTAPGHSSTAPGVGCGPEQVGAAPSTDPRTRAASFGGMAASPAAFRMRGYMGAVPASPGPRAQRWGSLRAALPPPSPFRTLSPFDTWGDSGSVDGAATGTTPGVCHVAVGGPLPSIHTHKHTSTQLAPITHLIAR